MTQSRPTALVTGASSGIGVELARLLAADNHELILVARRRDRLQALAQEIAATHGVPAHVHASDLAAPGAVRELWDALQSEGRRIDVLVNNAGIALPGPLAGMDRDALSTMVLVNVNAVTDLTRAVLPSMLDHRKGRILNVASLAGFQPGGPNMAAYYATKSYVVSFTRALARELRGSGVTVTALCPGPVRTEMGAGLEKLRLFRWIPVMDARTVAEAGLRAMHAGRTVEIPGFLNKALSLAGRLSPAALSIEVNHLLLR